MTRQYTVKIVALHSWTSKTNFWRLWRLYPESNNHIPAATNCLYRYYRWLCRGLTGNAVLNQRGQEFSSEHTIFPKILEIPQTITSVLLCQETQYSSFRNEAGW